MTTSCARSRAPSLVMARLMCVLAVSGLTTSLSAISSLDSPAATSETTSRSRSVRAVKEGWAVRRGEAAPCCGMPESTAPAVSRGCREVNAAMTERVTLGKAANRREHVLVIAERGEHDDMDGREFRVHCDAAGGRDTIHVGHAQIHQHHVWALLACKGDGSTAVRSLADDSDVGGVKQQTEPCADEGLIVGEQHTNHG